MKIEGPGNTGKTGQAKKTKRSGNASGAGFAESMRSGDDGEVDGNAPVQGGGGGGVSAVSSLDLLLAAQGVGDATDDAPKKQTPGKWGGDILDRLDAIRLGLLAGRIPADRLHALRESLARERERTDDPELSRLIKDIELRARVELAKLGQR